MIPECVAGHTVLRVCSRSAEHYSVCSFSVSYVLGNKGFVFVIELSSRQYRKGERQGEFRGEEGCKCVNEHSGKLSDILNICNVFDVDVFTIAGDSSTAQCPVRCRCTQDSQAIARYGELAIDSTEPHGFDGELPAV